MPKETKGQYLDIDYIPGTFFHATSRKGVSESIAHSGFDISKSKWAKALYFTNDPEFANQHIGFDSSNKERYTKVINSLNEGKINPSVFPVNIEKGNYFDPNIDSHLSAIKGGFKNFVQSDNNIYKLNENNIVKHLRDAKENSWSILESKEVSDEIRNAGFEGFYVREKGITNLAVFDQKKIKSVFETGQSIAIDTTRSSASNIKGTSNILSNGFKALGNIFKNLK